MMKKYLEKTRENIKSLKESKDEDISKRLDEEIKRIDTDIANLNETREHVFGLLKEVSIDEPQYHELQNRITVHEKLLEGIREHIKKLKEFKDEDISKRLDGEITMLDKLIESLGKEINYIEKEIQRSDKKRFLRFRGIRDRFSLHSSGYDTRSIRSSNML
jgi:chromosome segregation ATPase